MTLVERSALVLVAEGNTVHRRLIVHALADRGHSIHAVGTLAEARASDPRRFDVALVSQQLEDGVGLTLVAELAADPSAPPTVLLVERSSPIEAAEAILSGAVDLVVKTGESDMGGALRLSMVRALERRRLLTTITELEQRLDRHTRVDPVSGVYTGHYFLELLQREIARIRRFGGVMALLQLRDLTAPGIERTLGPHVRDSIVREIGAILRGDLRLTDLVGCWPDGRFVVALTGTDRAGALTVAARLSGKMAELESRLGIRVDLVPEPEVLAAGDADVVAAVRLD